MSRPPWSTEAQSSSSRVTLDPLAAPKVSQVDCEDLDEGLVSMLSQRVHSSLGNFQRLQAYSDLKPEISLILKLVIFRCGILASSTSPGGKLVNLKLANSQGAGSSQSPGRRKLLLYLLLHPPIFPSYILTRLRQYALSKQWPDRPSHQWQRKAWRAIVRLEDASKAWELLGWGMFLYDGRYPSLLMRILGLRLVPSSDHVARLVSYEFMNRQLVWGTMTEFLMFAVPILPTLPDFLTPSSIVSPIKKLLQQSESIDYAALVSEPGPRLKHGQQQEPSAAAHAGKYASLPKETCPICYRRSGAGNVPLGAAGLGSSIQLPKVEQKDETIADDETRVFIPARTDCWGGCQWCYYCIADELVRHRHELDRKRARKKTSTEEEDRKWECLRCGGSVSKAWRVGPSHVEPAKEHNADQAAVASDTENGPT